MQLIKIAGALTDLKVFDNKTASLLLFETASYIIKDKPFANQLEANSRLKMLLFALQNFEIENDANRKYIDNLATDLRLRIHDYEPFDEHLNFQEYIILRDITLRINELKGGNDEQMLN